MGIMIVPGNPSRNWNSPILSPQVVNSQRLAVGGGWKMLLWMLASPLSLWLGPQRCLEHVVGEGTPR